VVPPAAVVVVVPPAAVVVVVPPAAVVVVVAAEQVGTLIVFSSSVTAPVCANTRPFTVAPVFNVADVNARIVPMNEV
jgi:hypothetical protein